MDALQQYLDKASVASDIFELRPDYRVVLIAATGIHPGPGNEASEALLHDAEQAARTSMQNTPVTDIPHVTAWREAFKAFKSQSPPGGMCVSSA